MSDVIQGIGDLAVNGSHSCIAPVGVNNLLSSKGLAMISAVANSKESSNTTCGAIASFAGKMVDLCGRPDGTMQAIGYLVDGYEPRAVLHRIYQEVITTLYQSLDSLMEQWFQSIALQVTSLPIFSKRIINF